MLRVALGRVGPLASRPREGPVITRGGGLYMMYLHLDIRSVPRNLSGCTGNVNVHVGCSVAVGIHD